MLTNNVVNFEELGSDDYQIKLFERNVICNVEDYFVIIFAKTKFNKRTNGPIAHPRDFLVVSLTDLHYITCINSEGCHNIIYDNFLRNFISVIS